MNETETLEVLWREIALYAERGGKPDAGVLREWSRIIRMHAEELCEVDE